jgi:hypothetical protein
MMRKLNAIFMIVGIAGCNLISAEMPQKVALTSRILEIIDGLSIGIDGEIIGIMLQVRKKILEMMEGKRKEDGSYHGLYEFEGEFYSIHSFEKLETELATKQKIIEDEIKSAENKEELEGELKAILLHQENLIKQLGVVKKEFEDAVGPFLNNARNVKEPLIMLITESCTKHNRLNSLLLDWAKIEGEDESDSFNKGVNNFAIFSEFCKDLVNFLEDLVRSCPKAQQQFRKLKAEHDQKSKNIS